MLLKNNYELTGELHFHFSNAFYEPENFVDTIKNLTTSRTFVTDGECIVFANAFNDGRFLKAFEDNGFEVYERDSGRLIQDVFNEFNERQIHTLKAVINSALESAVNNKPLFVTSNSNSEATHDCVREYVSKYDLDHAVVIQLSNLNEEFKKTDWRCHKKMKSVTIWYLLNLILFQNKCNRMLLTLHWKIILK